MSNNKEYFGSGMLSDNDIRKYYKKGINIFTSETGELEFNLDKQLKLGSVDLRFRHEYKRFNLESEEVLSYKMLKDHTYTQPFELRSNEKLKIQPGEIIITTSLETVQLSESFAGIITGRSSIARLGIMVHCCQEFINPGHSQPIPLQIINLSPYTVELDLKIPICQIVFFKLSSPASNTYANSVSAKYSKEISPQNSKIYQEMNEENYYKSSYKMSEKSSAESSNNKINIKNFLTKYVLPFLPSLVMVLFITPFINSYIGNNNIDNVFNFIKNITIAPIIGIVLLIIYFWLKKGEKK